MCVSVSGMLAEVCDRNLFDRLCDMVCKSIIVS